MNLSDWLDINENGACKKILQLEHKITDIKILVARSYSADGNYYIMFYDEFKYLNSITEKMRFDTIDEGMSYADQIYNRVPALKAFI